MREPPTGGPAHRAAAAGQLVGAAGLLAVGGGLVHVAGLLAGQLCSGGAECMATGTPVLVLGLGAFVGAVLLAARALGGASGTARATLLVPSLAGAVATACFAAAWWDVHELAGDGLGGAAAAELLVGALALIAGVAVVGRARG